MGLGLCTELYHGMFFIFGTLLITSFLLFCLILVASYVHHYYQTKPSRVLPMQLQDFQDNHPVYVQVHASSRSADGCVKCDSGSVHSTTELFGKAQYDREKAEFHGTYTLAPVQEGSNSSQQHQLQHSGRLVPSITTSALTNVNSGSDIDEQRLRDLEEGRAAVTSNNGTSSHHNTAMRGDVEMMPIGISTAPPQIPLYIHHNPAPIITNQNSGRSSNDSPNENQSLLPHELQDNGFDSNIHSVNINQHNNNSSNENLNSDNISNNADAAVEHSLLSTQSS